MTLNKNQLVIFEDGHSEGFLEARWSERNQAFYSFTEDGDKIFSTTVIEKPIKSRKPFTPNAKNCTVLIKPCGETEKAYIIPDGTNGCISRGNVKYYNKFIAKSICYIDENGNVYAPIWA